MSSFNWIGTQPSCGNEYLLKNVLRDEWGFVGFVETDYDGSYGYMVAENAVRSGNNLMLGFGNGNNPAAPNSFPFAGNAANPNASEQSASLVKAMRESCKNIMYVIVNSGYYATQTKGGMDNMTKLFLTIDISVAVVIVALEAVMVALFLKKKKKA